MSKTKTPLPARRGKSRVAPAPRRKRGRTPQTVPLASKAGRKPAKEQAEAPQRRSLVELFASKPQRQTLLVALAVVLVIGGWAYASSLAELLHQWLNNQDYSHGLLIVPGAAFVLWARRASLQKLKLYPSFWGVLLVLVGIIAHMLSARFYFMPLSAWSIPLVLAGLFWILGGIRLFAFAVPALLLLYLAVPLPSVVEKGLRMPLQNLAAMTSSWTLNALGRPALAEENVVMLGEHVLEVAQACSGLRMFYGITALAAFYVLIINRPWWQKGLILLTVPPIAVIANTLRIAATGLLYEFVSGEAAKKFSHDIAGYLMVPLAALMLAGVVWCLKRTFIEVQAVDSRKLARI